ncbi:hypothetical protein EJ110_NYTH39684 [Nymphaea thermarum]|nr:hypothetical protein EJ110_NYTH39684 [Nymphaea thermarum]
MGVGGGRGRRVAQGIIGAHFVGIDQFTSEHEWLGFPRMFEEVPLDFVPVVEAALEKLVDRHLVKLFKRIRNKTTYLDESFGGLFVLQHVLLNELVVYVTRKEKMNTRLTIKQGYTILESKKENDMISLHPYCMAAIMLSELLPLGSLKSLKAVILEKISLSIPCSLMGPFNGVQKLSMTLYKVNKTLEICLESDIQTMFPYLTELQIYYMEGLGSLSNGICNIVNKQKLNINNYHNLSTRVGYMGTATQVRVRMGTDQHDAVKVKHGDNGTQGHVSPHTSELKALVAMALYNFSSLGIGRALEVAAGRIASAKTLRVGLKIGLFGMHVNDVAILGKVLADPGLQVDQMALLTSYWRAHARNKKMQEFHGLQQNNMNLEEYVSKYWHLEVYCSHLYTTNEAKADKFVHELHDVLRSKVMSSRPRDLDEAVTMARHMEEDEARIQKNHHNKTSQHS